MNAQQLPAARIAPAPGVATFPPLPDAPGQVIVHFRDCDEPLRFPDCVAVLAGDLYLVVNRDTQEIETRIAVEAVARIDHDLDLRSPAEAAEVANISDYRPDARLSNTNRFKSIFYNILERLGAH